VHLSSTSYDRVIIANNQEHFERDTRHTIRIMNEIKFCCIQIGYNRKSDELLHNFFILNILMIELQKKVEVLLNLINFYVYN